MYNVLQDIENILSVSSRGDTLIWTWVMSYFIVTVWSHKEAFHWDRFMFAKESSEFFFPPTAFNLKSHPSLWVWSVLVCKLSGLIHNTLALPWDFASWEGGRGGGDGGGSGCRKREPMCVFLTTLFLSATSWNWKQRGGPRQHRKG